MSPHGNKDREKDNLKTDTGSCSPEGTRIFLLITVILKWNLTKIDLTIAFLQSGIATRDFALFHQRGSKIDLYIGSS